MPSPTFGLSSDERHGRHILHDWDLAQKRMLLEKAHAALPTGGALIVYEASHLSKNAPSLQGIGHADVARSRRRGVISAVKPDEPASKFQ
jgi:O-methyltransferase domain